MGLIKIEKVDKLQKLILNEATILGFGCPIIEPKKLLIIKGHYNDGAI